MEVGVVSTSRVDFNAMSGQCKMPWRLWWDVYMYGN